MSKADPKPKLSNVASLAGVSTATASQVMRGTGRISEKTRLKVLDAAKSLHYIPDGRAASMRSRQNCEVGFVINQIANPFNAEVVSGVSDLLEGEGYLVSVLDARDDPNRQSAHIEAFIRNGRGGLLWVPAPDTPQETVGLLKRHNLPTVTFLRRLKGEGFDHVGIRNTDATSRATEHLIDLGHRHIAYLGGHAVSEVHKDRVEGYRRALKSAAMARPIIWESDDNKSAGIDAMIDLLAKHPKITAVVCNGDMVALGACLALQRAGLTPGQQVSVVGFDNIQDAAVATPALTTMELSPYQMGRRLARVLLDRIQTPSQPPIIAEVSAQLCVRQTTGPNISEG